MTRPITFLSDYGYADEFAGVCRAVMVRTAPGVEIIDITHGVPRHAVRQGAVLLANSLPFAPAGIHLAVVDPGVGSERRPVAVSAASENRILVGPDNGVLALAIERLGGATEAVDLFASPFRLESVTHTFHGRDLFAPVAARLAAGATLDEVGETIDPATLGRIELPEPRLYPNRVVAHVIYVDGFGNAALNVRLDQLADGLLKVGDPLRIEAGRSQLEARFARVFADVGAGEALVYEDSSGTLALAVNRGSAAERLGLAPDDEIVLEPGG